MKPTGWTFALSVCAQSLAHAQVPPTPSLAAPLVHITLDHASIAPDFALVDGGVRYPRVINGTPEPPQIVTAAGRRAIRYAVPAGTREKERIEHKLATSDQADALHFGNARFTAFWFMLDAAAAQFQSSALIFQQWQGFPYGPPVALKLTRSVAPFALELAVRNMATGPDSATPDQVIFRGTLAAGEWHRFVVGVRPSLAGDGEVTLDYDGARVADWRGPIGYDRAQVPGALDGFDTKFGLYQPDTNAAHVVCFSDVVFAASRAAVQ
jgi:hypothetical protein